MSIVQHGIVVAPDDVSVATVVPDPTRPNSNTVAKVEAVPRRAGDQGGGVIDLDGKEPVVTLPIGSSVSLRVTLMELDARNLPAPLNKLDGSDRPQRGATGQRTKSRRKIRGAWIGGVATASIAVATVVAALIASGSEPSSPPVPTTLEAVVMDGVYDELDPRVRVEGELGAIGGGESVFVVVFDGSVYHLGDPVNQDDLGTYDGTVTIDGATIAENPTRTIGVWSADEAIAQPGEHGERITQLLSRDVQRLAEAVVSFGDCGAGPETLCSVSVQ